MTDDTEIWSFNFWESLKQIARKEVKWFSTIWMLTADDREKVVSIVKEQLAELIYKWEHLHLLLDNHYTIYKSWKIVNTFPDENILFYDKLTLFTAPPKVISNRILAQPSKQRVIWGDRVEYITSHQELEEERAIELSKKFHLELKKVLNIEIESTLIELRNFLYL